VKVEVALLIELLTEGKRDMPELMPTTSITYTRQVCVGRAKAAVRTARHYTTQNAREFWGDTSLDVEVWNRIARFWFRMAWQSPR